MVSIIFRSRKNYPFLIQEINSSNISIKFPCTIRIELIYRIIPAVVVGGHGGVARCVRTRSGGNPCAVPRIGVCHRAAHRAALIYPHRQVKDIVLDLQAVACGQH